MKGWLPTCRDMRGTIKSSSLVMSLTPPCSGGRRDCSSRTDFSHQECQEEARVTEMRLIFRTSGARRDQLQHNKGPSPAWIEQPLKELGVLKGETPNTDSPHFAILPELERLSVTIGWTGRVGPNSFLPQTKLPYHLHRLIYTFQVHLAIWVVGSILLSHREQSWRHWLLTCMAEPEMHTVWPLFLYYSYPLSSSELIRNQKIWGPIAHIMLAYLHFLVSVSLP